MQPSTPGSDPDDGQEPTGNETRSFGQLIQAARRLFIEHGLSEAQVSLREVNRIRDFIQTFSPTQGELRATLNAFWLTLGVSLSPEQRSGELGQELRRLILEVEIPGVDNADLERELGQIIEAKPVEFDSSLSAVDALWKGAEAEDPIYCKLDELERFQLRGAQWEWLIDGERSELITGIQHANGDDSPKARALGRLAQNPNLDRKTSNDFIRWIKKGGLSDARKVKVLCRVAQNPNLDRETLDDLIRWIKDRSEVFDNAKEVRSLTTPRFMPSAVSPKIRISTGRP
jgi:hypothetical protein